MLAIDIQCLQRILSITEEEAKLMMANDTQRAIDILFEDEQWSDLEHQSILATCGDRLEKLEAIEILPEAERASHILTQKEMYEKLGWKYNGE